MSKIAVLGLGAMGSRMAANLIKAGHQVTVWNRSPAAVEALVAAGATAAATPKAAAGGAEFVIAMVRDDAASREVWLDAGHGALAGMAEGAVAIESSTLTPQWVRELGQHAAARGTTLLEAPVSGSRPQAEAGQLVYLVGGDGQALERAHPVLAAMGSAVHHVGVLGHGALTKLATNALLGIQVTTLAEIVGLLQHNGVDVQKALGAISSTSVWAPVAHYLVGTMVAGNFAPQFPIELIEKDFGYTVQVAGSAQAAPTIAAARGVFQQAITRGLAGQNMTGVVRLFTEQASV
ncbi:NAD(P)-dependent oxidoreductase [Pseudomonas aeruginosa]|uniref:NAD(P)-dependent oxidoreductase n=1 Tax=Pseudomonas aeruginosa TaxID=287 RepID=UPI00234BCC7A|nr:NAD(P)-dependent oxidoreductase [Pseudomonas aeruginosa]MDG4084187.1 NAD(P)-dependent oxidoreductase [Pseudomonas aeruginosa]